MLMVEVAYETKPLMRLDCTGIRSPCRRMNSNQGGRVREFATAN